LVYADDILISSKDEDYISEIKKGICAECDMTDMGELDNFLNAKITRTRKKISISQTHYYLEVLKTLTFWCKGGHQRVHYPSMQ
jgi:hypothetical protein